MFYEPESGVTYFAAATDLDFDLNPGSGGDGLLITAVREGDSNSPGLSAAGY